MAHFYTHNIKESIALDKHFSDQAKKIHTFDHNLFIVEKQILHLEHIVQNGLPDCYEVFEDFLYDFYPEFSWTHEQSVIQFKMLMNDSRFAPIVEHIKSEWNFDLLEDVQKTLIVE